MQRWSTLFIPTLREAPADAEVASHKLLLRAGYIRQLGAGIYNYLPLGQRSINKITAIVREEMDRIGGQEFLLPALNPVELWQESGREAVMGQNLFHLQDRKGAELVLAMTHEEVITSIARNELRSYKQLPQIWYQIQTKFRDEPRPKSGLLRVRQFLMKDSYSFDLTSEGLDESYRKHDLAYRRIFTRCGLEFVAVEADSGAMGGSGSQEFMVYTEAGEDLIASCSNCNYAANVEKAKSPLPEVQDLRPVGNGTVMQIATPNATSIEDVANYLQFFSNIPELSEVTPAHTIKTLAFMVSGWSERLKQNIWRRLIVLLRGDQRLSETKLLNLISDSREIVPMNSEQIEATFGGPAGYIGPLQLRPVLMDRFPGESRMEKPIIVMDNSLRDRNNLVAGANKAGYHVFNVTPNRDFKGEFFDVAEQSIGDISEVQDGDPCPDCVDGVLRVGKTVEIGHIFKLGTKYTQSMGSRVLDSNGKETTPIMGCYGIGIERILTSAIESSAAKFAGFAKDDPNAKQPVAPAAKTENAQYALPPSIAPYEVVVCITNIKEQPLAEAGERIAEELTALGIDVLLDDRDERAGVKFKDAELIGIPFRVNIGKKLAEGAVELVDRLNNTTLELPVDAIAQHVQTLVAASKQ